MSDAVVLKSQSGPLVKARSTNYTTNGYPSGSAVGTSTKPVLTDPNTATGRFAFELTNPNGGMMGPGVWVYPFGTDTNNNTFSMRVLGWKTNAHNETAYKQALWYPVPLIEVQATLSSTCTGEANGYVLATEFFADTITITGTTSNQGVNCNVVSPANDTPGGRFWVNLEGAQLVEFIFTTGGVAASCNALWAVGGP